MDSEREEFPKITSTAESDDDETVESEPDVYLKYDDMVLIYERDLDCLQPSARICFPKVIMEYYIKELCREEFGENRLEKENIYVFNPSFYEQVKSTYREGSNLYRTCNPSTNTVDVFKKDLWLIPVCEDNHWYLILVTYPYRCTRRTEKICRIFLLDDSRGNVRIKCLIPVKMFLVAEAVARGVGFTSNIVQMKLKAPQLKNDNHDCGLYVLFFIKCIIKDKNQNRIKKIKAKAEMEKKIWRSVIPTRNAVLYSIQKRKRDIEAATSSK